MECDLRTEYVEALGRESSTEHVPALLGAYISCAVLGAVAWGQWPPPPCSSKTPTNTQRLLGVREFHIVFLLFEKPS